jgi:RNA polymerase sigma-70 factor, ECF subfamily
VTDFSVGDAFADHRNLLFAVAYDLLGSVADAEDVVQETWLRWSKVPQDEVHNQRAYLVRIATTQALNRLRANRSRREIYVGPWLPEPIVEPDPAEEITDRAAREYDISIAMLVVLETLSPAERAVFVLREVFGMPHDEVAATLGRTPASVRQLAHRAREHVDARRPRFAADASKQRQATEQFLQACVTGDMSTLLELLAPDVSLVSDGGGQVKAARRPILGADKVARFMIGISQDSTASNVEFVRINGAIGLVAYDGDAATFVGLLDLIDDRIASIYIMVNPDKLQHLHRRALDTGRSRPQLSR